MPAPERYLHGGEPGLTEPVGTDPETVEPVPVPAGSQPIQNQNLNLNLKNGKKTHKILKNTSRLSGTALGVPLNKWGNPA
jgi:hypothetical protein